MYEVMSLKLILISQRLNRSCRACSISKVGGYSECCWEDSWSFQIANLKVVLLTPFQILFYFFRVLFFLCAVLDEVWEEKRCFKTRQVYRLTFLSSETFDGWWRFKPLAYLFTLMHKKTDFCIEVCGDLLVMHYGDDDNGLLHLNPASHSHRCVCVAMRSRTYIQK